MMRYFYTVSRLRKGLSPGGGGGGCQNCIRLTTLQIVDKDDEGYWAKHNFLRHLRVHLRVPNWRRLQPQLPFPYDPVDSS